jgi:hypothetical protein
MKQPKINTKSLSMLHCFPSFSFVSIDHQLNRVESAKQSVTLSKKDFPKKHTSDFPLLNHE